MCEIFLLDDLSDRLLYQIENRKSYALEFRFIFGIDT